MWHTLQINIKYSKAFSWTSCFHSLAQPYYIKQSMVIIEMVVKLALAINVNLALANFLIHKTLLCILHCPICDKSVIQQD